jgi:TolA-binding protein
VEFVLADTPVRPIGQVQTKLESDWPGPVPVPASRNNLAANAGRNRVVAVSLLPRPYLTPAILLSRLTTRLILFHDVNLESCRIMASRVIPLQDLEKRISQQQAELAKLRQEYDARQTQLRELTRRKEELLTQLQQVEAEMQSVGQGDAPPHGHTAATPARSAKPAAAAPGKQATGSVSLAQLLLHIVAEAGRPISAKELAREVVRRKHPTTSKNIPGMVKKRVSVLVKRGLLRHAPNRLGVLPARAQQTAKTPAAKSGSGAPGAKPTTTATKAATTIGPAASKSELALPALVTQILAKSQEPMTARQLAAKVLASGYQTKSKSFTDVIWAGVGKMKNVENVPGKGYRLKKGKTAASTSNAKGSK